MFEKDPKMFAYEPLYGYGDDRDAVELPWEQWAQEAESRERGVADLFAEPPDEGRSGGEHRAR